MYTVYNNDTLKLARNYLGLSQKDFSKQLNVSQALISNIEKGLKPLGTDVVNKLGDSFNESFFSQKMNYPVLKVNYRASSNVAKKYIDLFESRLKIISNNVSVLLNHVNIPENNIPKLNLDDYGLNPKIAAQEVRRLFNLGMKPIDNILNVLEKNGVIIHFFEYDFISEQNKNFDGVSFFVSNTPVIIVNKKIQNARKVFTIAHELAHLTMHNHSDFYISSQRDIEKEANEFASEFIAPDMAIKNELTNLSLEKLFYLKAKWKISIGALLYKAKNTTLSYDQYRRWVTKLAAFRKSEPNDFLIDRPILLKKILNITIEEFGKEEYLYRELGLSQTIFNEIYSSLLKKQTPHLKVIL